MKVGVYATLRPIVGAREIEIELPPAATVRDLVALLVSRWPALEEHMVAPDGALSRRVNVLVDGRNVRWLAGMATPLAEAGRVDIFPPVAGG